MADVGTYSDAFLGFVPNSYNSSYIHWWFHCRILENISETIKILQNMKTERNEYRLLSILLLTGLLSYLLIIQFPNRAAKDLKK